MLIIIINGKIFLQFYAEIFCSNLPKASVDDPKKKNRLSLAKQMPNKQLIITLRNILSVSSHVCRKKIEIKTL